MQLPVLTQGKILCRYKRFFADVELSSGEIVIAHCPNTGAMTGCWSAGAPVQMSHNNDPKRKLRWTLERVDMGKGWIGVNTYRPNQVIEEGLKQGKIDLLKNYQGVRREVVYVEKKGEKSRIDFLLTQNGWKDAYVEVKSVTLFDGDRLRFPDAVSKRGLKHLNALLDAVEQGSRGIMLYAINRPEGDCFSPAEYIDADYAKRLLEVVELGVEIIAVRLQHEADCIVVGDIVEVQL